MNDFTPLLTLQNIRQLADSPVIFKRGELLQKNGAFRRIPEECTGARHVYEVDGNFGNYRTEVALDDTITARCTCPYPGDGCKHAVAILLELLDNTKARNNPEEAWSPSDETRQYLSAGEIRQQAMDDRALRAARETLQVVRGDMLKGDHLVITAKGKNYQATLHTPSSGAGHCSCPDFQHNQLGTCKHLIFLRESFKAEKGFADRLARETFPYVDIFWDSEAARPRLFHELEESRLGAELAELLAELFDGGGLLRQGDSAGFIAHLPRLLEHKLVRIQEPVLDKLARLAMDRELAAAAEAAPPLSAGCLKVEPYPYQLQGVRFGLYKRAVLIGDEMGLGKTLQAIALAVLKKEIFGFSKVLIVTLSSLKQQWQREIARFTGEEARIIAGPIKKRREAYQDPALFKITNYEAVLRDVTIIARMKPDLIVLDEAQRIKNFATKTAEAVKSLPRHRSHRHPAGK